ncbi:hypothetical protein [Bacillus cereus group sp. BfR-BA-01349]|uniref:nuclear transport factor 2 family protein n=1 Tax=Bacillus cereus group sp. BfR-BA-01349 TaxID=2920312 RepID=UPI001F59ACE5
MKLIFRCMNLEWDDYKPNVTCYYEDKEKESIIVKGFYSGIFKKTQRGFQADFVHIWNMSEGKIIKFEQCVDSHVVWEVMNS